MSIKNIKVLIVDDSAVVRQALASLLQMDKNITVTVAADPFIAAKKIQKEVPDVITLDIEMPHMDGITFLKRIMSQRPIPVVIISSLTQKSAYTSIEALHVGAIDVLEKPSFDAHQLNKAARHIIDVVRAASRANIRRKQIAPATRPDIVKTLPGKNILSAASKIVAVGASTGGVEALQEFLQAMPVDCHGIVIVQHMPEIFTRSFADRLNQTCRIEVKEAEQGDNIMRGRALIAPGNKHMEIKRSGARYYVQLSDSDPVNRHRPSIDVLFSSVAHYAAHNAIGIIMTGMGADGARGLLEMKMAGAYTIAQDEKSSVVFGMPKEAIKLNAAAKILPLTQIATHVLQVI
jgi:two-component system chemotaxis response regulator CheB